MWREVATTDHGEDQRWEEGESLLHRREQRSSDSRTALGSNSEGADTDTNADRIVRHVASLLQYDGAPIAAHVPPDRVLGASTGLPALQVTLNHIPLPPANIPWEDLIQFRNETELRQHLSRLRVWVQERALSGAPSTQVEDELVALLHDYRQYMQLQHRKFGEGALSTVVLALADAVEQSLNFKPGTALRTMLDIRARRIALEEAELTAPGREVAYVANVSRRLLRGMV